MATFSSEPYPKILVNQAGDRVTVYTFTEQDDATRKGFYRNRGRVVEREDALARAVYDVHVTDSEPT